MVLFLNTVYLDFCETVLKNPLNNVPTTFDQLKILRTKFLILWHMQASWSSNSTAIAAPRSKFCT